MLVSLKSVLGIAEAENIAIGAFNLTTLEGIRAVIEAAEELEQPVILQFANAAHKHLGVGQEFRCAYILTMVRILKR